MKSNEKPNYWGIMPANVRYDDNLKPMEKIMYLEFTCLTNKYGYSTASNSYFAGLYDVDSKTVSRWISNLEKNGYIKTEIIRNANKQVIERMVFLSTLGQKNQYPSDLKVTTPSDLKVTYNNTSNNNINNNIVSAEAEKKENPQKEITDCYVSNYHTLFEQGKVATEKPVVNYQIVSRNLKLLLKSLGKEQIILALNNAMNDSWIVANGYSIATILSANQLNKLINAKPASSGLPKRNERKLSATELVDKLIAEQQNDPRFDKEWFEKHWNEWGYEGCAFGEDYYKWVSNKKLKEQEYGLV